MNNPTTHYIVIENAVTTRDSVVTEVTFIFNVAIVPPSVAGYHHVRSYRRDRQRVEFWINSNLDREPSPEFMEGFLRSSNYPTIVRFRNGVNHV